MLQIVSRVMEGNTVVGYILADGVNTIFSLKEEVWNLAKAGQILNVKAIGHSPEQGLTGVNGFELKKLKIESVSSNFSSSVYTASVYRNIDKAIEIVNNEGSIKLKDLYRQFVEMELNSGVLNKYLIHAKSNSLRLKAMVISIKPSALSTIMKHASEDERIVVRDYLLHKNCSGKQFGEVINKVTDKYEAYVNSVGLDKLVTESLLFSPSVVGYIIENIGDLPVSYQTVNLMDYSMGSTRQINPGESAALSRIETTMLMSKPTINFDISNAKVCASSLKGARDRWHAFSRCYLAVKEGNPELKSRINVQSLPESEISRFITSDFNEKLLRSLEGSVFKPGEIDNYLNSRKENAHNKKLSSNRNTSKELKNAKGFMDVMNAFKR